MMIVRSESNLHSLNRRSLASGITHKDSLYMELSDFKYSRNLFLTTIELIYAQSSQA